MRRRILAFGILAAFTLGYGGSAPAAAFFCPHTSCRTRTNAATPTESHDGHRAAPVAQLEATHAGHCATPDRGDKSTTNLSVSDTRGGGDARCAHCFTDESRPDPARAGRSIDSVKRAADVDPPTAAGEIVRVSSNLNVAHAPPVRGDPPNLARRERHILISVFRI